MREIALYRAQKIEQTKKLQKKTEDLNKLSQQMMMVLAENSYLREICQVNDENFGVNIDQVVPRSSQSYPCPDPARREAEAERLQGAREAPGGGDRGARNRPNEAALQAQERDPVQPAAWRAERRR